MTKLLDEAVEAIRRLPPSVQDDVARLMLSLSGEEDPCVLSEEDRVMINRSRAEAARGEFVTDGQVQELWKKLGL